MQLSFCFATHLLTLFRCPCTRVEFDVDTIGGNVFHDCGDLLPNFRCDYINVELERRQGAGFVFYLSLTYSPCSVANARVSRLLLLSWWGYCFCGCRDLLTNVCCDCINIEMQLYFSLTLASSHCLVVGARVVLRLLLLLLWRNCLFFINVGVDCYSVQ